MNVISEKTPQEQELSLAEKRRAIVNSYLNELIENNPQLYYESTSTIARVVHRQFAENEKLSEEDAKAIKKLSVRDVELILAFRQ